MRTNRRKTPSAVGVNSPLEALGSNVMRRDKLMVGVSTLLEDHCRRHDCYRFHLANISSTKSNQSDFCVKNENGINGH